MSLASDIRAAFEAPAKNNEAVEHTSKPRREPREKNPTQVSLAEVADDDKLVVRNCSTNEVMEALIKAIQLTPETTVKSGRYLQIYKNDLPAFQAWASQGGFFVKESRIDKIMVYDLMVDNSNRFHQNRHGKKD